jgi:phosphatidylserine decarboxylase
VNPADRGPTPRDPRLGRRPELIIASRSESLAEDGFTLARLTENALSTYDKSLPPHTRRSPTVSLVTFAAAQILRLIPKERISHVVGRLCEQPMPSLVSSAVSRVYSQAFDVDMSEAAVPHGGYRNFDAFFTRPLRSGARCIADSPMVSPSDGYLSAVGPIDDASRLFVKGQPYEVGELVGSQTDARRFVGGSFGVIYLSPRDYHRVHSPVDGYVEQVRAIEGELYPVNAIGERHIPKLYLRNRRVTVDISTEELGRVTLVLVGALIVGKISVNVIGSGDVPEGSHPLSPLVSVHRGDELGAFHLGSTVVLLSEQRTAFALAPGSVRMGQSLSSEGL